MKNLHVVQKHSRVDARPPVRIQELQGTDSVYSPRKALAYSLYGEPILVSHSLTSTAVHCSAVLLIASIAS